MDLFIILVVSSMDYTTPESDSATSDRKTS